MRNSHVFSLPDAIARPSPNREPRAGGRRPDLVILHYTAMIDAESALARLTDPAAKVSAHYLIGRDGALYGLVPETERAWHAGVASWGAETDVNSRSIGVELDHPGHGEGLPQPARTALGGVSPPFPEPQMARLEALLAAILARWAISPWGVLAHSDVASGRKLDPGEKFDWRRLARGGLAVAAPAIPEPDGAVDAAAFLAAARRLGYGADWSLEAVLDATRRRFRPAALDRALEPADTALLRALARTRDGDQDPNHDQGQGR